MTYISNLEKPVSNIKSHLQYPVTELQFLQKAADGTEEWVDIGHEFYKKNPLGFRTPEGLRWSLHKTEFYYLATYKGMAPLVGRSIIEELGDCDFPPLVDEHEIAESQYLPTRPISREYMHYLENHTAEECYWPRWIEERNEKPGRIPKLDRTIRDDIRIETLIVHDPDNITQLFASNSNMQESKNDTTSPDLDDPMTGINDPSKPPPAPLSTSSENVIQYNYCDAKRTGIPWVPVPPTRPSRTAHLHLSKDRKIGTGHSAIVWKGELHLPTVIAEELFEGCFTQSSKETAQQAYLARIRGGDEIIDIKRGSVPTRFSVAVKIAEQTSKTLAYCKNEAIMYAYFPQYLAQDWTGYQVVAPINIPQPACAIVPKNYGFFVPDVTYGKLSNGLRASTRECMRPPILLLEECGNPVKPTKLKRSSKAICLSLILRLHRAGFVQQSLYERNFLAQPGPLNLPPDQRSMKTPSFRVIDFGRGIRRNAPEQGKRREFEDIVESEQKDAERMLDFSHWQNANEPYSSDEDA